MTDDTTQSAARTMQHRRFPGPSFNRMSLMIVLATVMYGQALMMQELGVWTEGKEMYQVAIWFAILYGFLPQVRYAGYRLLGLIASRVEGEST